MKNNTNKKSIGKCLGCAREFAFNEIISPLRKYCSRRCYLDATKWGIKPEVKEEIVEEVKEKKKSLFEGLSQFIKNLRGK